MAKSSRNNRGRLSKHGMNWIRPEKRLAIYIRESLACLWCGRGVEDGVRLTLDHYTTNHDGGDNSHTNLFTACAKCNSTRKNLTVEAYAEVVADSMGNALSAAVIIESIQHQLTRPIDVRAAQALIISRGGLQAALGKTLLKSA